MDGSDTNGIDHSLSGLNLNDEIPMASSPPPIRSPGSAALSKDDFRDITDEFNAASDMLEVGQLVKDPTFTLLQAVGALEIMDPKMDSGLLEPEYESFDAVKPRLPEEIIGIMDRLLCHEMAWHLGHALAQTVFTNLYIDKLLSARSAKLEGMTFGNYRRNPDEDFGEGLVEKVLQPYCLSLIKCCGLVNRQVLSEHTYEEEDFITQTYGRNLLNFYEGEYISGILDSALEWLLTHQTQLGPDIYEALRCRVKVRLRLLLDLSTGLDSSGGEIAERWATTRDLINELVQTHSIAKPVDWAWSTSVQRKLASQVPPRPIVDLPFQKATDTLKSMCSDIISIPQVLNTDSPADVLSYFYHFMTRKHTPLPYTRTLLQSAFSKNGIVLEKFRLHDLVFEDLKDLCFPLDALLDPSNKAAEAPQSPKYQIAKRMEWFAERTGRAFYELFKMLTQNRARLRRNLCHTILDWDTLQIEAEEVDNELKDFTNEEPRMSADGTQALYSFPLSSWTYYYKIRQMEWIQLLGFELDIYQPHEFAGMYWYLQHYVRARLSHLGRIREFVEPRIKAVKALKRRDKAKEEELERGQNTYALLNYLMMEGSAIHDLATALTCLYAALSRLSLIRKPRQPYGTDELRYELRMKPFLSIGLPDVIPFEHFQAQTTMEYHDTASLLEQANVSIAEAKKQLQYLSKVDTKTARATICEEDHKTNMKNMLRSCFGIGVAVGVLAREVEEAGMGPETEGDGEGLQAVLSMEIVREGFHKSFPVPSIKRKKEAEAEGN